MYTANRCFRFRGKFFSQNCIFFVSPFAQVYIYGESLLLKWRRWIKLVSTHFHFIKKDFFSIFCFIERRQCCYSYGWTDVEKIQWNFCLHEIHFASLAEMQRRCKTFPEISHVFVNWNAFSKLFMNIMNNFSNVKIVGNFSLCFIIFYISWCILWVYLNPCYVCFETRVWMKN